MDVKIKEKAIEDKVPIIRDESYKILIDYVKKYKPKNILEIGTAVGYSGMAMLEAYEESVLTTIELDDQRFSEAVNNFKKFGFDNRVNLVKGDCCEIIESMSNDNKFNGKFDFVFLDGPKGQYIKMLDNLIKLTKSGGIILADNVLFRGYVRGDKSNMPRRFKTLVKRLEMFLDTAQSHPQIKSCVINDIEDGLCTITVK